MPPIGKELERLVESPEATAVREVESYIEKIEKQTEKTIQDKQGNQTVVSDLSTRGQSDDVKKSAVAVADVKKIVLPLSETDIMTGFKSGVFEGLRWLSEWCVMMIKKYPGRVFYSPKKQYYD